MSRTKFRIMADVMLAAGLACGCGSVLAAESAPPAQKSSGGESIAEKATNPTSFLMQMRLQNAYTPSYRKAGSYGNAALFQGVFPTKLGWGSAAEVVINRVTMPYVTTPEIEGVNNGRHAKGMGDTLLNTWFISSWLPKGQVLAWGTTVTIPTAGDNEHTGAGQWQAGPTAAYVNTSTPSWQWGGMFYQQWDFSSTRSDAADVSALSLQPIITKHFKGGWYISAPDAPNTYDFKTNKWTLALGAAVGRVTTWGSQPIQLFAETYYNPVKHNRAPSPEWTFKVNISFLLPESN